MTEEQRQLAMDIQNTFSTVPGKRTLKWLKELCGYDDSIDPWTATPGTMMYFLGGREIYIRADKEMNVDTTQPVQQPKADTKAAENKEGNQQQTAIGG